MSDDVSIQIENLMEQYSEEVQQIANEAIKEVAQQTAEKLKSTSPQKSGQYARSWKVKAKDSSATVYNTRYQLTHLLENGHVVRNKSGTYGRARAFPHIAPAEEWAAQELQSEIERRLG